MNTIYWGIGILITIYILLYILMSILDQKAGAIINSMPKAEDFAGYKSYNIGNDNIYTKYSIYTRTAPPRATFFSGFAGGDEHITTGNYEENYLTPTELISWNKQKELINNNDKDIENEKNNKAILADYVETKL